LEILDLGALPSGERYMVMEFLDGETLTDRIKARDRLPAEDAVKIVRQVLRGLAAAHNAGIVHRDLKPDNIFILKEKAGVRDYVKIIDFGISKFAEQGASSRMTRTGALMGTPHYMAPEQATGSSEIDRRTDIYAVGIILYEAVTGRVPFQAETFNQLLFEIALAKITPATQIVPELDPAIDTIIMRASARDPVHRFQSCDEFAAALESWEKTGSAVSLPPEQSLEMIVAATVPRTSASPSHPAMDAAFNRPITGSTGAGVSKISVTGNSATAVSAGPAPSAQPHQPTVNSWANASQASPPKSGPPVLVATAVGILLLLCGVGAYFIFKPAPVATPAASVPSAVPTVVVKNPETPPEPVVAPAPPPPASAAAPPVAEAAPLKPAQIPHHSSQTGTTKPVEKTEKVDTARSRKPINFGY
jgi:serine/threonine protein kinase